jgi:hypothetical protein
LSCSVTYPRDRASALLERISILVRVDVWSAGGDLIDRPTYRKVDGFLNGPPALHALTILQQWYKEGHWFYDRYAKAFPDNVKDLYIQQLENGVARPRPQTPAYPALSDAFARAFNEVVVQGRRSSSRLMGPWGGRRRTS